MNTPQPKRLTSDKWLELVGNGVVILDPDGWDRKNYQYSFYEELITEEQFNFRLMLSTIMKRQPEPISNIDEILSSDHTKGSHADDFSDREPCYCNRKQRIQHLITQEQIKELNKVPLDSAIDQCYIALAKYRDNRIAELEATLKENK